MEYVKDGKNFFFQVLRIIAKVFEIWGFESEHFNLDYKEDVGSEKEPGTLREAVNGILSVFGG